MDKFIKKWKKERRKKEGRKRDSLDLRKGMACKDYMTQTFNVRNLAKLLPSQHKPHITFLKCVCRNLGNPVKAPFSHPGSACWHWGSTSLSKGHQVRDRVQLCVQGNFVEGSLWMLVSWCWLESIVMPCWAKRRAGYFHTVPSPPLHSTNSSFHPGKCLVEGRIYDS